MKRYRKIWNYGRRALLPAVLLGTLAGQGQLCSGSLGDPVVNITFGSGTGTDPGLTPAGSYQYISNSCPNDGFYSITNFTSGCFSNAWHTVNADHTGNGAFMIVNASYQPGDFIYTTVSGLCPNTTYEFAAWVMNVLNNAGGIKPNITFRIETLTGTVLNQFNSGDIAATASPQWQQYGFFFTTTPGSTSVVLRMTNNAPGGGGNDLALDDITFRPCGPLLQAGISGGRDTVEVCVYEQTAYTFSGNASSGFTAPLFQWQASADSGRSWQDIAGAAGLSYLRNPSQPGLYLYRLSATENGNQGIAACRIASNVLVVHVYPRPVISAGPDRVILAGNQATLLATAADSNLVFSWSPPDNLDNTTRLNPVASPATDKLYSLSAVSPAGCMATDQVTVRVIAGIFVPTAFTPNNDGKNDRWRIPFLDPVWGATVSVYNRYGQQVYQVTGATVDWDGKLNGQPQPTGTYVYQVRFRDKTPEQSGTFTLIR